MGLTFTIVTLCIIYYIINKYYPNYITWHINYGFIGIIISYLVIQYLINFEYPFVYKTMKNIYNSNNQPLYTNNSSDSNSQFYGLNTSKNFLLEKQNHRCYKCHNILNQQSSYMVYTNPLKYGGENTINNLSLLCNSCYNFHN